jgi:hypothetical protein
MKFHFSFRVLYLVPTIKALSMNVVELEKYFHDILT